MFMTLVAALAGCDNEELINSPGAVMMASPPLKVPRLEDSDAGSEASSDRQVNLSFVIYSANIYR